MFVVSCLVSNHMPALGYFSCECEHVQFPTAPNILRLLATSFHLLAPSPASPPTGNTLPHHPPPQRWRTPTTHPRRAHRIRTISLLLWTFSSRRLRSSASLAMSYWSSTMDTTPPPKFASPPASSQQQAQFLRHSSALTSPKAKLCAAMPEAINPPNSP